LVAFASLFLGLVFGWVDVEMNVAGRVARVDLLLDGVEIARVVEPWRTKVDLGVPPAPRELVAVAFDGDGREVGRARQWINRPRAVAEASFLLEPGAAGERRVARLGWRSATGDEPESLVVTFDGDRLPVADPARVELPPHSPDHPHVLRAELVFPGNVTAVVDTLVGGRQSAESLVELTAVVVALDEGASPPLPGRPAGWLLASGEATHVVAVEQGPAEVTFVAGAAALAALAGEPGGWKLRPRRDPRFPGDVTFRFASTVPRAASGSTDAVLYPVSQRFGKTRDRVRESAVDVAAAWGAAPGAPRIADAVATAGMAATEAGRRRAVGRHLRNEAEDESTRAPEEARVFLETQQVPLVVWAVGSDAGVAALAWPRAVPVFSDETLKSAVAELSTLLGRQRVAWLSGTYLPQLIALAPSVDGIRLAR
jgi:hypothetical protein